VKQPERRAGDTPGRLTWADYLNTFLTTFISAGMLAMAFAQWRATEKQADIADTLARLEIAKSEAKFEITGSKSLVDLGPGISNHALSLPKSISVRAITGVKSIDLLDGQAFLRIYDNHHSYVCDVEARGIYIENEAAILTEFDEPIQSLRVFLHTLLKQGLTFDGQPLVLVRYHDLFGTEVWKQYRANDGFELSKDWMASVTDPAVLYSGAWSNGQGFYFDQLPKSCGPIAKELEAAAKATGGGSGAE
jgi:hypothetical protein